MTNNTRRNFVKLLPYVLVGGFTYPIGKFIFFSDNPDIQVSMPLKNINDGITYIKQSNIFIYKKDKNIDIYDAHCTHMGCILNFDNQEKQFNCPCHKSRFDIDGTRLRGPAKRDLDKIAFKIKNKTLYVG
ncbi:MAG: ubiquinol-cytochrome c reductase iron-sulfur subunit [Campylobacterota bacterium]|nr:ubiquinol-cytochrome c reductase iron-sulfur subunit [Campylobacterota bacterium]